MQISDEQANDISKSIDDLTKAISNVDLRLTALCGKLAILSKIVKNASTKE